MQINKLKIVRHCSKARSILSILGKIDVNKAKREEILSLITDLRHDYTRLILFLFLLSALVQF